MEPTIYKPGAYKTPGVYKGAGGIYNGLGVYNDGGGGSPLPPGYTRYDFIEYVINTTSVLNRMFSLPINVDSNEDLEIYLTYKENLTSSGSYLLEWNNFRNSPYDDKFVFQLWSDKKMYRSKNGGEIALNAFKMPAKFLTSKVILKIKNDSLYDGEDESLIGTRPSIYGIFSMANSYIYPFLTGTDTKLHSKRYELKGVKNGITLFDFVPVVEDATSEPGFYDLVNNLFVKPDDSSHHNYAAGNDT